MGGMLVYPHTYYFYLTIMVCYASFSTIIMYLFIIFWPPSQG